MPGEPAAQPGMALDDVDTPALIVDLDAFERNLVTMAAFAEASGVRLRPHAKTHKSPEIAMRQIAHGAVGQCCQKVGEAEILVAGGVTDVLVTNEIAGAAKLDRLAKLAHEARIGEIQRQHRRSGGRGERGERAGVDAGLGSDHRP